MLWPTWALALQTVAISLSGVLSPGPMTTAALAGGARRRHTGAGMAIGHGIIEFPLMGLIVAGAGVLLERKGFRVSVGFAGGAALLLMAAMMLLALRQPVDADALAAARPGRLANPVWTGIALTAVNPYFLVWWATVGLGLVTQAVGLGMFAFILFAVVHWLCDLIWLEFLSVASYGGTSVFGPRSQKAILACCAAAMLFFGGKFVVDAWRLI